MRQDHLYIDVKVYGGADVGAAIAQMAALAARMRVGVWAEINGVRTLARFDDSPEAIFEAWKAALATGHKYASTSRGDWMNSLRAASPSPVRAEERS